MPMIGAETEDEPTDSATSPDGTAGDPGGAASSNKSKSTAIALAFFGGLFGLHHFYLGNVKRGFYYVLGSPTLLTILFGIRDAYRYSKLSDRGFAQTYGGLDVTEGVGDGPLMAESFSGRVELHDEYVKIYDRVGSSKRIPLDRVDAVEFTDPIGSTGYIQFEQASLHSLPTGLSGAKNDENSVTFHEDATEQFRQFRDAVDAAMFGDGGSDAEGRTADEPENADDETDPAIRTLREQFAKGELSREEFEERKAVLEGE